MTTAYATRETTSEASLEAQGLEVVVAAATTETAATDDVIVDGRIITAENYDAALGQDGSDLLIVNNGDGSDFLEGGEGVDFVQVNGANTAGCGDEDDDDDGFVGGMGNDTVQVNGSNTAPPPAEDGNDLILVNDAPDTLFFVDAVSGGETADGPSPVLMVIANQDFHHREYHETRGSDIVATEEFSLNYEEIKVNQDTSFDAVFDAM